MRFFLREDSIVWIVDSCFFFERFIDYYVGCIQISARLDIKYLLQASQFDECEYRIFWIIPKQFFQQWKIDFLLLFSFASGITNSEVKLPIVYRMRMLTNNNQKFVCKNIFLGHKQ